MLLHLAAGETVTGGLTAYPTNCKKHYDVIKCSVARVTQLSNKADITDVLNGEKEMGLFIQKFRKRLKATLLLLGLMILVVSCGTAASEYIYSPTPASTAFSSGALDVAPTPTIVVAVPEEVPTTGITVIAAVRADLSGTLWQLRSQAGEMVNAQITLQIVGNQISGLGGCNTYFATYEGIEETLVVDEIGRTEIFCEQTMEAENRYLAALESATTATRDGSTMAIQTAMGELVFKPVGVVAMENEMAATESAETAPTAVSVIVAEVVTDTPVVTETVAVVETPEPTPEPVQTDFITGSYLIQQVRQGDMVRRVADGVTSAEMTFAAGAITGNAGCNNFNATYTLDGDQLRVSPIASTRIACTPALSAQEQMVFEALQTAQTARFQGRDLIIDHASGTLLLRSTEPLAEEQPPVAEEVDDGQSDTTAEPTATPESTTDLEPTLPIVTGFDINILSAVEARIGVNGLFSDGCTRVTKSEQAVSDFIITFNVFVERDPTLTCIPQAIPFRETFDFEIVDLPPGDYTVIVNGAQGAFRLNDLGN